jgi:hypothetical protein
MTLLFSLVESPLHPRLGHLYQQLGITVESFGSARKLHKALQQQKPNFFVGDFIYGYANNYAGTNLSNLDVTLATMQGVAPETKVIVFVQPTEEVHARRLSGLFPIHAILKYPVVEQEMRAALLRKSDVFESGLAGAL